MNFALIGAAGYIAPRHIKAIAETSNSLIVAHDISDSVGRLDNYFPDAEFFTDRRDFFAFCRDCRSSGHRIDYTSICTPNHTHSSFSKESLRLGTDVICEKPLALSVAELESLMKVENETGHKVYNILQLRLHDSIAALRRRIGRESADKVHDVDLTYITSRGKWYHASWKGDIEKSGGIATNIGVHFYDMLQWVFGSVRRSVVHMMTPDTVAGYLELDKARVRYFLSINASTLPAAVREEGKRTWRTLSIDGEEFEFSDGFTDLHTESYRRILAGEGFRIGEAIGCIATVEGIRSAKAVGLVGDWHPLASQLPDAHMARQVSMT